MVYVSSTVLEVLSGQYFVDKSHGPSDFNFVILDRLIPHAYNRINLQKAVLSKEVYRIYKLETYAPFGLNSSLLM